MSANTLTAPTTLTGSFTPEAFAAHLASLPPSLPAWWLDRKRAAYARFAALPMPARTDEMWRFSNIGTLTLDGFTLPTADTELARASIPHSPIGVPQAAKLVFANGRLFSRELLSAERAARGVIVDTLHSARKTRGDRPRASPHPAAQTRLAEVRRAPRSLPRRRCLHLRAP